MKNNKNLNIKGLILSNIICTKESNLRGRKSPKYGTAIMLVTHLNEKLIKPAYKNQIDQERLVMDLLYLIEGTDPNYGYLKNGVTNTRIEFNVDPYAIFTKATRYKYFGGGFNNYLLKLFCGTANATHIKESAKPSLSLVKKNNILQPKDALAYVESQKVIHFSQDNSLAFQASAPAFQASAPAYFQHHG